MKRTLFVIILCVLFLVIIGYSEGEIAGNGYFHVTKEDNIDPPEIDGALLSAKNVKFFEDLSYVKNGHEKQKLDIYLPETNKKLPLIIFIHGGGWREGDKRVCKIRIAPVLTKNNYIVASINYRLSDTSKFPAQIHDVKTAVRWLRANANKYRIKRNKVGVWGISAGGHLASLLGTSYNIEKLEGRFLGNPNQSSKVQAVVDFYGPVDPSKIIPMKQQYNLYYTCAGQLLGNKDLENYTRERIDSMNPIKYIDPKEPPFLIMHGAEDPVVPVVQSRVFAWRLKENRVKVIYKEYPGEKHNFAKLEHLQEVLKFFAKHLKKGKAKK